MLHSSDLTIKILHALHGDALRIRFLGSDLKWHNIFVDCGLVKTYKNTLRQETQEILDAGERVDLFVITHTDQDHISGIIPFIKEFGKYDLVDKYWFNHSKLNVMFRNPSDKISISDGIKLRDYLTEQGKLSDLEITSDLSSFLLSGATLTVLSPTRIDLQNYQLLWRDEENQRDPSWDKISVIRDDYGFSIEHLVQNAFREDTKLENRASITFLFQTGTKTILFLADSHPSTIVQSLREQGYSDRAKLKVDYVKLSHHGSKANTNNELLTLLDCNSFIVSANGKNRHCFPHKETLARILLHPQRDLSKHIQFIFNYNNEVTRNILTKRELGKFNCSCFYPDEKANGYTIYC